MPEDKDQQNSKTEKFPTEPTRVLAFARFFKNYMNVSSFLAAALPIPVTAISLIPTYAAHTKLLSTYTPMVCFLLLGYIFYMRQKIGQRMFGAALESYRREKYMSTCEPQDNGGAEENKDFHKLATLSEKPRRLLVDIIPLMLIILSIATILVYHHFLDRSIALAMNDKVVKGIVDDNLMKEYERKRSGWLEGIRRWQAQQKNIQDGITWDQLLRMLPPELRNEPRLSQFAENPDKIMELTPLALIPQSLFLMLLYIGFFVLAESAFIFMAVKEYIQDLLRLSDTTLLTGDEYAAYKEISQSLGCSTRKEVREKESAKGP